VFVRRRLSTSARVALTVTIAVALGSLLMTVLAYVRMSETMAADVDRSLLREAEAYSAALQHSVPSGATDDLLTSTRTYLRARTAAYSVSRPILLVRFADGRTLSNSDVRLENAPTNVRALDPALASRTFVDIAYLGNTYRAATVPISGKQGGVLGVFEAARPLALNRQLANEMLGTLAFAGVVAVLSAAMLSVWAARASLSPLRQAARTAERVTQSSLSERVTYDGPDDEVGLLVHSVNSMLDRVEGAFGEQRRFVADASHELRTPLQVVSGHLEMLEIGDPSPEERVEEIALLQDEVRRMNRLVEDMLALARLESGHQRPHQPVEVTSLLQDAAARGRVLGGHPVIVSTEEGQWVAGDPDQLMEALLNLIANAADHSPPGGPIKLASAARQNSVVIEVVDSGTGIRTQDLPRLFDRFYRAQGPRTGDSGGSGLGLAIVKRLIELHGGKVSAANRAAGGAVFRIVLPRTTTPCETDNQ
jgi:two-component system OmpR family sensor kinase